MGDQWFSSLVAGAEERYSSAFQMGINSDVSAIIPSL